MGDACLCSAVRTPSVRRSVGSAEHCREAARTAVLIAGLPVSVPGVAVNRLCGSSLQAAMDASRLVETGDATAEYFRTGRRRCRPGSSGSSRHPGGRLGHAQEPPSPHAVPRGGRSAPEPPASWAPCLHGSRGPTCLVRSQRRRARPVAHGPPPGRPGSQVGRTSQRLGARGPGGRCRWVQGSCSETHPGHWAPTMPKPEESGPLVAAFRSAALPGRSSRAGWRARMQAVAAVGNNCCALAERADHARPLRVRPSAAPTTISPHAARPRASRRADPHEPSLDPRSATT